VPSVICLGTGSLGSTVNREDSFRLLDAFLDLGGNFVDTANVYADWLPGEKSTSEKTIGRWLRQRGWRERVVLATKGAHPCLETMHVPRLSPKEIVHDLEQSLGHLQTDYVDLYWLHRDDPSRPVAEIIEGLNEQIRVGKIRYIGCSNWTVRRIEEAEQYAKEHGLQGFVSNQMMWSLAKPNIKDMTDKTMIAMADGDFAFHMRTNLPAIPYSSQANGFFSGRYSREAEPERKSVERLYFNEKNFQRLNRVEEVAAKLGRSQTEIALAWLLSHPFPVYPIIGPKSVIQLTESCRSSDLKLEPSIANYIFSGR
jgi:aryl-alcohol dehydrogenase-like predicted oxidoreductase